MSEVSARPGRVRKGATRRTVGVVTHGSVIRFAPDGPLSREIQATREWHNDLG